MKAFVRINAESQEVRPMEVPVPEIGPGEVLLKVEAFGVGIHDRYFIPANATFPYIIGSEGAGTIVKSGEEGNDFSIGDRVIFTTILQAQGGCWAPYAVAKKEGLIRLPDNMTFEQGAAIPIAGTTALESMRSLNLNTGESLFIAGASGAIGTLVIQIAAAKGICISASASAKNHDYLRSLGVDKAVDYNDPNWQNEIKEWSDGGVNAALAIQPGTGTGSIQVVKDSGRLITVSGDSHTVVPTRNITVQQMGHHADTRQKLAEFVHTVSKGEISVVIEKEYAFEQALEALQKTETRHARGKLVVKL